MRFQISENPDISQFIIQITGNRLIILVSDHRHIHLTVIHGSGISVILKDILKLLIPGNHIFEREELDTKARFNEYIMTS